MKYEVFGTNTKKMLNMLILEILRMYYDEQHPLTQQEILRLLRSEYGVEQCDRRSVKANVLSLKDMGFEISMEAGEGYYLKSELNDAELRWLIDAVLFSKSLPSVSAKRLIGKLKGLGNEYFESKIAHVSTALEIPRTNNKQVLISVQEISDAIDQLKTFSQTAGAFSDVYQFQNVHVLDLDKKLYAEKWPSPMTQKQLMEHTGFLAVIKPEEYCEPYIDAFVEDYKAGISIKSLSGLLMVSIKTDS